jgi:3-oxoacyl-[acyl-carrier-protein] synthase-3
LAIIQGRPVGILGTGMKLPLKVVTNSDLEKQVDTSDEWIVQRSGIHERRIAQAGETNAALAAASALDAMTDAGVRASDINMVMVGTNSPDTLFPGVAPAVQSIIGAGSAGGMDIQSGCAGSLFAIASAAGGIASGIWENVIVIGSEVISPLIDQADRGTCVLFGDGAAACVMGPWRPGAIKVTHADMKADGAKGDLITLPGGLAAEPASERTLREKRHFLKMNGREVFKFVSRELPDYLANFCQSCGITCDEVDWWIFHQANIRIIENVRERMNIPMERVVINLDRYGNTSAASIMLALHEARESGLIQGGQKGQGGQNEQKGQKILITSFGAGMTYGAVLAES